MTQQPDWLTAIERRVEEDASKPRTYYFGHPSVDRAALIEHIKVLREAHKNTADLCGAVNFSSHNQIREAVEGALQLSEDALAHKPGELSDGLWHLS